jgi:carboxypeptidase C (cathepsin A)
MMDRTIRSGLVVAAILATASAAVASDKPDHDAQAAKSPDVSAAAPDPGALFQPEEVLSDGSVTIAGKRIDYEAAAGTIVVHPKGWDDAAWREKNEADLADRKSAGAEASMFYVAYFKKGVPASDRPITFLFNGGPGSSTVWLHMGAFGPRRVLTADGNRTPAAPYRLVNNDYSLLDVSDVVFIDAPGAGFSRVAGKDREKGFYGIDPDAHAFGAFIKGFLARYARWNSPRYIFGESYGTPRAAVLANDLETEDSIDLNGVILLSAALNFDLEADWPQYNPGIDGPYIVSLPTYAATAWYHNCLPGGRPAALEPFLAEVQRFASTDYAAALQLGDELSADRRDAIAEQMARYTGLSKAYILKSDLRINVGQFTRNLKDEAGITVGRIDTRFEGPSMDVLSREADYDPQQAAVGSAYVSAFNDYARTQLRYGEGRAFRLSAPDVDAAWSYIHQPPGSQTPLAGAGNTMPDLASAMKYNPNLKVLLLGGYFDLATPYAEGLYEIHHMGLPTPLRSNVETHYYPSGHMVYLHEASLKAMHDDVAGFIRRTDNLP